MPLVNMGLPKTLSFGTLIDGVIDACSQRLHRMARECSSPIPSLNLQGVNIPAHVDSRCFTSHRHVCLELSRPATADPPGVAAAISWAVA